VKAAGLSSDITIEEQDFKNFTQPKNKSILVTNPPYGERISTNDLLGTYKMIGERLKHQFIGNEAWVLSYREECFAQIGLKPSLKIPLFNGSLECEFRKYQMFDGKMREFREEGGVVKTEEEKRQMAEKRRFKQNREFKKRLDEEQENAEADIRNFKFRSLEKKEPNREFRHEEKKAFSKDDRDDRKPFRKNDRDDRKPFRKDDRDDRKPFRKNDRDDRKSFRKNDRDKKNFKKNNRRFQDDDED
jgi:putative N6-adenine-specific DNA methylase